MNWSQGLPFELPAEAAVKMSRATIGIRRLISYAIFQMKYGV
jgi:hypothetical protein